MTEAYLFDNDGTLIQSEPLHKKSEKRAIKKYFGVDIEESLHLSFTGTTMKNFYSGLVEHFGNKIDIDTFSDEVRQGLLRIGELEGIAEISGAMQFLYHLKRNNQKIGVATSGNPVWADFSLKKARLRPYIDTLVANKDYVNGKPAPDVFLEIAKRMDVDIKNCVVFEDSINGILSAKNAAAKKIIGISSSFDESTLYAAGANIVIPNYNGLNNKDFFSKLDSLVD